MIYYLIFLMTVIGISGNTAIKDWYITKSILSFSVYIACWIVQCWAWVYILRVEGMAKALTASSAMWIVGATLIGWISLGEHLSIVNVAGIVFCLVGLLMLGVK